MIDCLIIFNKTGTVHYTYTADADTPVKSHLKNIDKIIHSNRLEGSTANKSITISPYVLEWDFHDNYVAVASYKEVLAVYGLRRMQFVKKLLPSCLKEFSLFYDVSSGDIQGSSSLPLSEKKVEQFDDTFRALLKINERSANTSHGSQSSMDTTYGNGTSKKDSTEKAKVNKKGKPKKQTVWHGKGKVTQQAMDALDRSKDKGNSQGIDQDAQALMEARSTYLPDADEIPAWEEENTLDDEADENETVGWGKSIKGLFDQISGNKVLTEHDINAAMTEMEQMLISKNVAPNCAQEICEGVKNSLIGKKLSSFSRMKSVVRTALESSKLLCFSKSLFNQNLSNDEKFNKRFHLNSQI